VNVAIWLARQAIYNVRVATFLESRSAALLVAILTKWQKSMREFVSYALSSPALSERFACRGAWIRLDGLHRVSCITFTAILANDD